jgi:hypothetical protein
MLPLSDAVAQRNRLAGNLGQRGNLAGGHAEHQPGAADFDDDHALTRVPTAVAATTRISPAAAPRWCREFFQ